MVTQRSDFFTEHFKEPLLPQWVVTATVKLQPLNVNCFIGGHLTLVLHSVYSAFRVLTSDEKQEVQCVCLQQTLGVKCMQNISNSITDIHCRSENWEDFRCACFYLSPRSCNRANSEKRTWFPLAAKVKSQDMVNECHRAAIALLYNPSPH